MNRKFIIGNTYEEAMLKNLESQNLSHREKLNWIDNIPIIPNPLQLDSATLELHLFTYLLAKSSEQERQLTQTEIQSKKLITRLYQENVNFLDDIFAIEFTNNDLINFYHKIERNNEYNKENYINQNVIKDKMVWRIILFENITEYELRKEIESMEIKENKSIEKLFTNLYL